MLPSDSSVLFQTNIILVKQIMCPRLQPFHQWHPPQPTPDTPAANWLHSRKNWKHVINLLSYSNFKWKTGHISFSRCKNSV